MKYLILLIFVFSMIWQLNAQSNSFEQWDKTYIEVNLDELLSFEYEYADSIRTNYGDSLQFYFRADKYRFVGIFSGNWRVMPYGRKSTMDRIFRMVGVDQRIVKNIRNEVEILTEDGSIWMPIQRQIAKSFKKEVLEKSDVYIYSFFVNHHSTSSGLTNLFLISAFNSNKK